MKKHKKLSDNYKDSQISIKCKLTSSYLRFKIKEEKQSQTNKEWAENSEVYSKKNEGFRPKSKAKLKEALITKQCLEK